MVSEGPSNGRRATTPPKRGRNALLIGSETPLRTTHTALVQTIAPINLPRGGAGADCDWLALSARETTPRRASNRHLDPPPARVSQVNISKRLPEPPRRLNPTPNTTPDDWPRSRNEPAGGMGSLAGHFLAPVLGHLPVDGSAAPAGPSSMGTT